MDFGWTLLPHAILQRNKNNLSEHSFFGTASSSGKLFLRAKKNGQIVPGFDKIEIGNVCNGRLIGKITGLPVGGPYDLRFELIDASGKTMERRLVGDVLVGDLWILAGQSNMQGAGYLPGLTPDNSMLRNFYMDNRWDVSHDPLHNLMQAAAPVHGGDPNYKGKQDLRGVGPGMSFAETMWEITGVPQGTIACAHGGTSMEQWSPALRDMGGASLYGAMLERYKKLGGNVAGMLWYQGCNDTNETSSLVFETRFRAFLKAVRKDFKAPKLPIVFCQLGSHVNQYANDSAWSRVRFAQYQVGKSTPNTECVPTIDLALDDDIHLSAKSQQILGQRMAQAMLHLLGDADVPLPIDVIRAKVSSDPASGNANVTVTFRNVVGKLISDGPACGFFTPKKDELTGEGCFKVELIDNKAIVHTLICAQSIDKYTLAYGAGTRPFANLCDEAGRAVPCFTLRLKRPAENSTDMLSSCEISDPVYGPEDISSLHIPEKPEALIWRKAKFIEFYLEHPARTTLSATDKKVFYYRFSTQIPEQMELRVLLGADGPFALFCDGKEVHREFTGNPIIIDEFRSTLVLEKGRHDWYVALSSNTGHAYGICLRLVRNGKGALPAFVKP